MTDATTGDQVDNKVGDIEKAICDVFGVPIDTVQANAGFLWDATGLTKIVFQELGTEPSAAGEFARNGFLLKYHDGSAVRRSPLSLAGGGGVTVFNTASISSFYATSLPAGYMGVDGVIDGHVTAFVNSILDSASLTFRIVFGNTLALTPILNNNSGVTQTNFGVTLGFRLANRGTTNSQSYSLIAGLGAEAAGLNWGGVTNTWTLHRVALLTEDTTLAKNIQIDVQWSGASISNSVSGVGFEVHRLR